MCSLPEHFRAKRFLLEQAASWIEDSETTEVFDNSSIDSEALLAEAKKLSKTLGNRRQSILTNRMEATMKSYPILTDKNHADMDVFLGEVLERHKAGELKKEQAIGILAHVMLRWI